MTSARRRRRSRVMYKLGRSIEDAAVYGRGGVPALGRRVARRRGWRWLLR